jgi:hypothetical protein
VDPVSRGRQALDLEVRHPAFEPVRELDSERRVLLAPDEERRRLDAAGCAGRFQLECGAVVVQGRGQSARLLPGFPIARELLGCQSTAEPGQGLLERGEVRELDRKLGEHRQLEEEHVPGAEELLEPG